MNKNKKNTVKKSIKPAFVVDITNCKTFEDIEFNFAIAKQKAGVPLSEGNIKILFNAVVDDFCKQLAACGMFAFDEDKRSITKLMPTVEKCECTCEVKVEKKENIFKRFWNWLTHKK